MTLLLHIYLFLFGLVFGSFYNVVGIRTAYGQSIVRPRSHCPNCNHQLTAIELIPVISYLIQKGRCKNCRKGISWKYAAFEFATACLFTISPLMVGWSKDLLVVLILISLIMIITISDLEALIIPNNVLLFFGIIAVIIRIFIPTDPWWDAYLGSIVGFVLLLLLAILSRGGMGGGDIKLFLVLGLFVGTAGIVLTLVLASMLGLVYGLLERIKKKPVGKQAIPFGPFIGMAVILIFYYYEPIIEFLNFMYIDF